MKKTLGSEHALRELWIREFSAVAETVMQLNDIFETTQNAADQYIEDIRQCTRSLEGEIEAEEEAARQEAEEIAVRQQKAVYEEKTEERIAQRTRRTMNPGLSGNTGSNEEKNGIESIQDRLSKIVRNVGKDIIKKGR